MQRIADHGQDDYLLAPELGPTWQKVADHARNVIALNANRLNAEETQRQIACNARAIERLLALDDPPRGDAA